MIGTPDADFSDLQLERDDAGGLHYLPHWSGATPNDSLSTQLIDSAGVKERQYAFGIVFA